jgi:hypothetical protein
MFKPVGLEETGTAKLEHKMPQDTEPRRHAAKRERVRDQCFDLTGKFWWEHGTNP